MSRIAPRRALQLLLVACALFGLVSPPRAALAMETPSIAACETPVIPDFGSVSWSPINCSGKTEGWDAWPNYLDMLDGSNVSAVSLAYDTAYLYVQMRVGGDPLDCLGLDGGVWNLLVHTPTGDPTKFQYRLALSGSTDSVEIWSYDNLIASVPAGDGDEHLLFRQGYLQKTTNTGPLAKAFRNGDGTYMVQFAVPVTALIGAGVVRNAAEIDTLLFRPVTGFACQSGTGADVLDRCSWSPNTALQLTATVAPGTAPVNKTTSIVETLVVKNIGSAVAGGVLIQEPTLAGRLTGETVQVTASVFTFVLDKNPLKVFVPVLPVGQTVTIKVTGTMKPGCADADIHGLASAQAILGTKVTAPVDLLINRTGPEVCDGLDNDCDGAVDENPTALCSDGNACNGTETCAGVNGCQAGTVPNCNDGNACTVDACNAATGCTHTAIAGCQACTTAADCNDANACTTESCNGGVCGHTTIPGCTPCTTPADCNDNNTCTTESCIAGACSHTAIGGCQPCQTAADCGDSNACTTDTCSDGQCAYPAIPGCQPCQAAADCNDQNACSVDACNGGVCQHTAIPLCQTCTTDADCTDAAVCTADVCDAGRCRHDAMTGCQPCTVAADCNDANACTTDTCDAGRCAYAAIAGCTSCQVAAECDDTKVCTTDACTAGACSHQAIADCHEPGECSVSETVCGDGQDDDCDGLTDCADPDCADSPLCQPVQVAENCSDCVDNDGDGLVDGEDPDCCAQTTGLIVNRVRIVPPGTKHAKKRLVIRARDGGGIWNTLTPMDYEVGVQVSDMHGKIFCATITPEHWKPNKKHTRFRFKDKQYVFAGGLKRGLLKMRPDHSVRLNTKGGGMSLRPVVGGNVTVTLRIGEQCYLAHRDVTVHNGKFVSEIVQ